jgi:UPF0271 protein
MNRTIDLNGDVGESFGVYSLGNDAELLSYVSSANIACGFHAGDPATMRRTMQLCKERDVAIGAHPGFADLVGFGRRNMVLSPQEVFDLVVYQIGALQAFAAAEGIRVRHVKPHGALYNMAAKDIALARAIAQAVQRVDPGMILVGLSGSQLIAAGRELDLPTASEVFADRTYQSDGSLMPRSQPDAMIHDAAEAAARVVAMVQTGKVRSQQGTEIPLHVDTVCLHGDSPHAVEFAREIRNELRTAGIDVQPFSPVD